MTKERKDSSERLLEGRKIIITGASRDVGAGIFIALAKEGAHIIGIHRDAAKEKRARQVIDQIREHSPLSEIVVGDITNTEDRNRIKDRAYISFQGRLDTLILNASGSTKAVNVSAANALVDQYIPMMSTGSSIILLQSVPGHYYKELETSEEIPEFYRPIAEAKYEGEQSLRARVPGFTKKGIRFIVVCPPEIVGTSNMRIFAKKDRQISQKQTLLSHKYGLPKTVTIGEVSDKVLSLLIMQKVQGYTEFFK